MYNTKTLPKVKAKYDFIFIYVLPITIETVSIIYQGRYCQPFLIQISYPHFQQQNQVVKNHNIILQLPGILNTPFLFLYTKQTGSSIFSKSIVSITVDCISPSSTESKSSSMNYSLPNAGILVSIVIVTSQAKAEFTIMVISKGL